MCNYCNSGTNLLSSCFGCSQRICRDCNGNIRVSQNTGCGCQSSCGCQQNCCQLNCGCNGGTTENSGSNGRFACFTVCGNANSSNNVSTTSTGGDYYYARQYGLLPYSSCPCSAGYNYTAVTQTT